MRNLRSKFRPDFLLNEFTESHDSPSQERMLGILLGLSRSIRNPHFGQLKSPHPLTTEVERGREHRRASLPERALGVREGVPFTGWARHRQRSQASCRTPAVAGIVPFRHCELRSNMAGDADGDVVVVGVAIRIAA